MKTRILPLFLLILCLCALFSSCASFENPFALLAEEWDDIAEFFEDQQPVESRGSLLPADGADLPLPRRLLASAAGGKSLTLTELLSQAASAVRLPDAVAVFSPRLSPRDADLLHRLRSDGVEVSLTMLPGSPEDFDAALLERLRLSGADLRTVTPEGVIS